jgi:hypothetical protein
MQLRTYIPGSEKEIFYESPYQRHRGKFFIRFKSLFYKEERANGLSAPRIVGISSLESAAETYGATKFIRPIF